MSLADLDAIAWDLGIITMIIFLLFVLLLVWEEPK